MNALLDKIVADRAKYCCNVKTLGAANIVSPIRHHDFVKDGQRVLLSGDMEMLEAWEKRLGHKPSFERAGPHERLGDEIARCRVAGQAEDRDRADIADHGGLAGLHGEAVKADAAQPVDHVNGHIPRAGG